MSTEKFLRLIRPEIIAGVGSTKRMSHDRVIDRLSDLEFVTRSITGSEKPPSLEIVLQVIDEELLYHLLAGEANRFFMAAILTKSRSLQVQPQNVAWQTVEHYYSAYYAVHYLMRMTGRSITSLDALAVKEIKRNFLSSDEHPTIQEGLYQLSYDVSSKNLTLKKQPKGGGSHKDAWAIWIQLLDAMVLTSKTDFVEYATESVDVTAHKKFILRSTGQYRPPEIRGLINYQFKGNCWQFEKNSKSKIETLQREIMDGSPLIDSGIDTRALVRNNQFIYSLAVLAFKSMAKNYPKSIARSIGNIYAEIID